MADFLKFTSLLLCTALSSLLMTSAEAAKTAAIPPDYTAVYQVLYNDKDLAEVTVRLSYLDDTWTW